MLEIGKNVYTSLLMNNLLAEQWSLAIAANSPLSYLV